MKISIITVSYNSAKTIRDTLQSVSEQSYPDIEYIIVDGNSKDATAEIVRSFGSTVSTFISEPDKGLYDAMNKGIKLASGDVVGILNSDDLYADAGVLKDVMTLFTADIDAVYADLVYVKADDISQVTRKWVSGNYHPG
jgi:glycosyltransferase involved in cell wall biosynthesis